MPKQTFPNIVPSQLRLLPAIALAIAFCLCGSTSRAQDAEPVQFATDAEIKKSMSKAADFLLSKINGAQVGEAAIGVVALVKSQSVKPNHETIRSVLSRLATRCRDGKFNAGNHHHANYEAAVFIMAFAVGDKEKYKTEIQLLVNWLSSAQRSNGGWEYPDVDNGVTNGDTSQTQYALLGLWEASKAGAEVDKSVFEKAARWHTTLQAKNGGYTYKATPNVTVGVKHTMTAGAIGSMQICRWFLNPEQQAMRTPIAGGSNLAEERKLKNEKKKFGVLENPDEVDQELTSAEERRKSDTPSIPSSALNSSIGRALGWLQQNYTIENPIGWPMYYLYSLERAMALANYDTEFAGHNWYLEGATYLISKQNADGSWIRTAPVVPGTAFGLMFLSRATAKTLGIKDLSNKIAGGLLKGGRGLDKDLDKVMIAEGDVKKKKMTGPIDEILAVLQDPKNAQFLEAQEALVNKVVLEDPLALVGKTDRLMELLTVKDSDVRRTAMWALGRSQDLTVAPTLIKGLSDPDVSTMIEARNALRFLSKRIDGFGLPDQPSDREREKAISQWKAWYLTVRPYHERDDLLTIDK